MCMRVCIGERERERERERGRKWSAFSYKRARVASIMELI